MIPGTKIDWTKTERKAYDTANEVYHKYGKDYLISEYVNEYKDGTNAKEIIEKAGGLKNLPHAMEQIKDSEVVIDMNEDIFTINRKIKLGKIAQRKIDEARKLAEIAAKESAAKQPEEQTEE